LAQSYRRVASSPRKRLKIFSVKIQLSKKTEPKKMATADEIMKKEDRVLNVNKAFMDNLEEYLTCSKCKKVPRNAIVSCCSAHHLICKSCFDSLATIIYDNNIEADNMGVHCTTKNKHYAPAPNSNDGFVCGTCYTCVAVKKLVVQCGANCKAEVKPALSSLVANLLEVFPIKCKFTHNGCQVIIKLKELEVHEVECVYRNINCPFLDCKNKDVSFIGLSKHLETNHENIRKIGNPRSKDFIPMPDQGQVWIPGELVFRNRSFFTVVHRDAEKSRHFWIYFHGTPEEAVHYSYEIKIIGRNVKELILTGNVFSLEFGETKETIMANEDVFYVILQNEKLVKRLQVDGQVNFEITLVSDKEEIKDENVESGISDDDDH
jgi:hypothetical protein